MKTSGKHFLSCSTPYRQPRLLACIFVKRILVGQTIWGKNRLRKLSQPLYPGISNKRILIISSMASLISSYSMGSSFREGISFFNRVHSTPHQALCLAEMLMNIAVAFSHLSSPRLPGIAGKASLGRRKLLSHSRPMRNTPGPVSSNSKLVAFILISFSSCAIIPMARFGLHLCPC